MYQCKFLCYKCLHDVQVVFVLMVTRLDHVELQLRLKDASEFIFFCTYVAMGQQPPWTQETHAIQETGGSWEEHGDEIERGMHGSMYNGQLLNERNQTLDLS